MYKLLIIEDDAAIAGAIAALAASWEMETHIVSDFRAVLTEYAAFSPHIVLVDISLPFFSGYHWCAELRKLSNVPIVFISSASDGMNIVTAMEMGADDFVAKPFDGSVRWQSCAPSCAAAMTLRRRRRSSPIAAPCSIRAARP